MTSSDRESELNIEDVLKNMKEDGMDYIFESS